MFVLFVLFGIGSCQKDTALIRRASQHHAMAVDDSGELDLRATGGSSDSTYDSSQSGFRPEDDDIDEEGANSEDLEMEEGSATTTALPESVDVHFQGEVAPKAGAPVPPTEWCNVVVGPSYAPVIQDNQMQSRATKAGAPAQHSRIDLWHKAYCGQITGYYNTSLYFVAPDATTTVGSKIPTWMLPTTTTTTPMDINAPRLAPSTTCYVIYDLRTKWTQDLRIPVTHVTTAGRDSQNPVWVTNFSLYWGNDGQDWPHMQMLPGNSDGKTLVTQKLDVPIKAKFLKLVGHQISGAQGRERDFENGDCCFRADFTCCGTKYQCGVDNLGYQDPYEDEVHEAAENDDDIFNGTEETTATTTTTTTTVLKSSAQAANPALQILALLLIRRLADRLV